MKVCPKCGEVIGFNSYFGGYICSRCEWEDDAYNKDRINYFVSKRKDYIKNEEEYQMLLLTTK